MKHARLLVSALALTGLVFAQEPRPQQEDEPEIKIDVPGLSDDPLAEMSDDQEEMVRLFHEVELTLQSIDLELFDASAGRIPLPEGNESGIERLLKSNGAKSDNAVTSIERILELAEKMGGSGGT